MASAQMPGQQPLPGVGKAISLVDATCDQIKAELATFDADKIPSKLADFGKAKYHPTAEESIRFARYVDVSKASKDKNCIATPTMKKAVTAQKTAPVTKMKTSATTAAAAPAGTTKTATVKAATANTKATMKAPAEAAAAQTPIVVKKKTQVPAAPAAADPNVVSPDEGVTVTVPDSSG